MEFTLCPSFKIQSHDLNVSQTTYSPIEIMRYFEDHHLSEILQQLMLRFFIDEPTKDVAEYLAKNLLTIANSIKGSRTYVMTDGEVHSDNLVHAYTQLYKTPLVCYTRTKDQQDEAKVAESLSRFLKFHRLEDKKLIILDFPTTVEGLQACQQHGLKPNTVVDTSNDQNVVKFLWRRKVQKLTAQNSDLELCKKLYDITHKRTYSPGLHTWWYPRIIMIGRRGSGRDIQAASLAKEFGLVLIDVEAFVKQQLTEEETCSKFFVATQIYERLLKPDCLHNGWVIFGYPNTVVDLEIMFQMIAPPNRIFFLHTRERVCMRRLEKSGMSLRRIQTEMAFYNCNIQVMADFCTAHKLKRLEVHHIDGTHSFETVKNKIWSKFL